MEGTSTAGSRAVNSYVLRAVGCYEPTQCPKCTKELPITSFYKHSVRSDGAIRYRPYCKTCRSTGPRKTKARPMHKQILESGWQTCKVCSESKPLGEFYANGCFADGVVKYRTRCKACVLAKAQQDHPTNYKSRSAKRSSSPKNFIACVLNHASKRKQHLGFDIDLMYLLGLYETQNGACAVSNQQMTYTAGGGRTLTNISIDRIDSKKGYIKGNVQLVCDIVNRMKSDMTQLEFVQWCDMVVRHAKKSL